MGDPPRNPRRGPGSLVGVATREASTPGRDPHRGRGRDGHGFARHFDGVGVAGSGDPGGVLCQRDPPRRTRQRSVHHIDRARQTLFVRHGKGARDRTSSPAPMPGCRSPRRRADRWTSTGCLARSARRSTPALTKPVPVTCSVTRRRRGCSKVEPTSVTSRNSSAMPVSKPPRSTQGSASTNSPKSTPEPTPPPAKHHAGPHGHMRVLHLGHVRDRRTRGRATRPTRS